MVTRFVEEREAADGGDFGYLWSAVGRSALKIISRPGSLRALLRQVLEIVREQSEIQKHENETINMQSFINDTRILGFRRIFFMFDDLDDQNVADLLQNLIGRLNDWHNMEIYGKFFLHKDAESDVIQHLKLTKVNADKVMSVTIEPWNEHSLRLLLENRFRAAKSRRKSLNDLAESDLDDRLDQLVFDSAGGSPGRYLRNISALIDVRVQRALAESVKKPKDIGPKSSVTFEYKDWEQIHTQR
jgi:hypothetical protein